MAVTGYIFGEIPGSEATPDTITTSNTGSAGQVLSYVDGTTFAWVDQASLDETFATVTPNLSGVATFDLSSSRNFTITMTASLSFAFSGVDPGRSGVIAVIQDGTGGRTFTLTGSQVKTPDGGAAFTQVTTANSLSILKYVVLDLSNILVEYVSDFA